jgi:sulfur-carrier protein adenylyltransferase/sulfurtransferase
MKTTLSAQEIDYYARQIILPEWSVEVQLRIKNARVGVIGAGALGCAVLQSLARAGVGHITIFDEDLISISNLQRQILYDINDVGKIKSQCAAEKIRAINPYIQVESRKKRIEKNNAQEELNHFDVVVDGSDNFETKFLLNDVCGLLKKPLVFGAIDAYTGQLSVFHTNDECPGYRSLFSEAPEQENNNCETIGVSPFLPQIIGGLQANETIKTLAGIGSNLCGKLLLFDSLKTQFSIFEFENKKELEKIASETGKRKLIHQDISSLSYEEFHMKRGSIFAVDVREESEHAQFNLRGINIPIYELEVRMHEIDASKSIVTYCDSGMKAKQAAIIIASRFEKKIYYLETPLNALKNSVK